MSESLHFAANVAHGMLIVMAIIYTFRVRWLLKFPAGKDRQPQTGPAGTTPEKGMWYSLFNIANPMGMESTRTKFFNYLQFVIFHLGVTAAIALSFMIPYTPGLLKIGIVVTIFQWTIGAACAVGVIRIIKRFGSKYLRAISTPDDYFSLLLLTVWFFYATQSVDMFNQNSETIMKIYFYMTAFFLFYVPFSKISHYLYYPFTRYYFGRTMGYRGVYPIVRSKLN